MSTTDINANNYTVYCHINMKNLKMYFGITKQKIKDRWGNGRGYDSCTKFKNAIKKYGWESFEHLIIKENVSKEDACFMEKELIKKYHTQDSKRGYNINNGGITSEVPKGGHLSEEQKKKISTSKKGSIPWNKGVPMTEERYEKCKNSFFKKGSIPWDAGKKLTDKQKEKLRNAERKTSKKVICVDTGVIFKSICEAARAINRHPSTIADVCKGKHGHKRAGGYCWKFV